MPNYSKDKHLYDPPASVETFYEMHGENYKEWYDHADELSKIIEDIFPKSFPFSDLRNLGIATFGLAPATVSPFNIYFINKALKEFGLSAYDMFKMNSHGLRSDEFTDTHDGLHILFAGCSITFGDGMLEEYIWPRKVYDMISSQEHTSGYYNIAVPGFNHAQIYLQIFSYIEKFGNPDYLFINFPDLKRLISYGVDFNAVTTTVLAMQKSLELYCKANNIKLIAFSWDEKTCLDFTDKMDNPEDMLYQFTEDPRYAFEYGFYRFNHKDRIQHYMDFDIKNKNHKYSNFLLRGFDIVHPGIAEHDFYAKFAYEIWKEQHGSISSR